MKQGMKQGMKHMKYPWRAALVLAAAFVLLAPASHAEATTVTLDTRSQQATDNEFTIQVAVDNMMAAFGMACDVVYDPAYLEVVDVDLVEPEVQPRLTEGTVFNASGADQTTFLGALEDGTPGVLVLGIARESGTVDATGSTLFSIHFIARQQGLTTVSFRGFEDILGPDGAPLTVDAWQPVSFNIRDVLWGDVDNDDNVSLLDAVIALRIVAGMDEDAVLAADSDQDSAITVRDAMFILQYVGELRR